MGIISSIAEHSRRIDPGVEKLSFSSREQLVNERSSCGRGFLDLKSENMDFDTLGDVGSTLLSEWSEEEWVGGQPSSIAD